MKRDLDLNKMQNFNLEWLEKNGRDNVPYKLFNPNLCVIRTADSYKETHWLQDPEQTEFKRGYIEARDGDDAETTLFGLQYYLNQLCRPVTMEDVDYSYERSKMHFGRDYFNLEGWTRIVKEFDGRLPLRIKAIPEGITVPYSNMLVWVENTEPGFGWLTQYIETKLLKIWYPTSVCTLSRNVRRILKRYLIHYTDLNPQQLEAKLNFMFHNFGDRGASSEESAMLAGMAHLAAGFLGTDSLIGLDGCADYYFELMAGYSVFASEHSTMTLRGQKFEEHTTREMLKRTKGSICSVVGDTWDIYNFARNICGKSLKQEIIEHGQFVIRPDSGSILEVPQEVAGILIENFGSTVNSAGMHVLPPCIRILQGDGVNKDSIPACLDAAVKLDISPENFIFGCGGKLVQDVNRDTHNFADKACSATVCGKDYKMQKSPITQAMKKSKGGFLDTKKIGGHWRTINTEPSYFDGASDKWLKAPSQLKVVFENGFLKNVQTLSEIRECARL